MVFRSFIAGAKSVRFGSSVHFLLLWVDRGVENRGVELSGDVW